MQLQLGPLKLRVVQGPVVSADRQNSRPARRPDFARPSGQVARRSPGAAQREGMRVAIVTESFLPQVNGVSNTVRHVVARARRRRPRGAGRRARPGPGSLRGGPGGPGPLGRPARLPLLPDRAARRRARARAWTGSVPTSCTSRRRSPSAWSGCAPRERLGVPTVAVYQTDIAGLRPAVRPPRRRSCVDRWVGRLHRRVDRTLVPSTLLDGPARGARRTRPAPVAARHRARPLRPATAAAPTLHGALDRRRATRRRVRRPARRTRSRCTGSRVLAGLPGVQLVVIGDGPARAELRAPAAGRRLHRDAPAAPSSRRRSPPSTSSCTPATRRPSARPSRRRRPAASRSSPRPPAGRSTWSSPAATGLLFDPADLGSLRDSVPLLRARRGLRHDLATAAPGSRSPAAAGRAWSTSWSSALPRRARRRPPRPPDVVRIAQLANFVGPTSGGMKHAVDALGAGLRRGRRPAAARDPRPARRPPQHDVRRRGAAARAAGRWRLPAASSSPGG